MVTAWPDDQKVRPRSTGMERERLGAKTGQKVLSFDMNVFTKMLVVYFENYRPCNVQ